MLSKAEQAKELARESIERLDPDDVWTLSDLAERLEFCLEKVNKARQSQLPTPTT